MTTLTTGRMDVTDAVLIADTLDANHPRELLEKAESALFWHISVCEKHGNPVPQPYFWALDRLEDCLAPKKRTFTGYGGK